MPAVLFNCPKTRRPVPARDKYDPVSWQAPRPSQSTNFQCPLCREAHSRTRDTASLAGSTPKT